MNPQEAQTLWEKATCLHTQPAVETAISQMAQQITTLVAHSNPIIVCALTGGIVITGQLLTQLTFPLQLDYAHPTRYGYKTVGGELSWRAMPTLPIENRVVVIIDDILDKGITLSTLQNYYITQKAAQVYTAVLVDKQTPREKGGLLNADVTGLTIPQCYAVGYGLDCKTYLRNAPGIFAI